MQRCDERACPHCGSDRTQAHGAFVLIDGTRVPRRLCHVCGRTSCAQTGTETCYLKKRRQWEQMPRAMAQHKTVRGLARVLGVRPATVFRWRHRLLDKVRQQPEPVLTGEVAMVGTFVRYSEKGSRKSVGPGAWGSRIRPCLTKPFRRIADGKPSCVLVACSSGQLRTAIAGQGRPSPAVLHAALRPILVPGCTVWTGTFPVSAADCRELGYHAPDVPRLGLWASPFRAADVQSRNIKAWLGDFRGVATRYLSHYLAWFRHTSDAPEVTSAAQAST